mmetsp:Transcript_49083/g.147815  ORF Transcript_49083/g.147815 Transcript_49083/m.147815 type:complete len:142 (-) Transcript_49083:363-788(-)
MMAVAAALADEEINDMEPEKDEEGVGSPLEIFSRVKEEEEIHEAKVVNFALDAIAPVEIIVDPQEDGERHWHDPGGSRILARIGGQLMAETKTICPTFSKNGSWVPILAKISPTECRYCLSDFFWNICPWAAIKLKWWDNS